MSQCSTADFAVEIIGSLKYYFDALRGKPETRTTRSKQNTREYNNWTREAGAAGPGRKMDFGTAFGVYQPRAETDRQLEIDRVREAHSSYDEAIRLAPYGYQGSASSPDPDTSAGG